MKASELRIENFVFDNLGGILKIKGINDNSDLSHIKPIPLTEEWLLKFGFEQIGISGYFSKNIDEKTYIAQNPNGFWIAIERAEGDDDGEDEYSKQINVQYVHQLQNLYFALTGEELEIKEVKDGGTD